MSARDDYLATIDMGGDYVELRRSQYEQAMDEIDRLRHWKAEAMLVLDEWNDAFDRVEPLGRLGDRKSTLMADEILRLRALVSP